MTDASDYELTEALKHAERYMHKICNRDKRLRVYHAKPGAAVKREGRAQG